MSSKSPPSDRELEALVGQLALEEKISLLGGKNMWETAPVERLDIPSLKFSDGPNGARGAAFTNGLSAACFPASVSLAASFNRALAREVGVALAEETKSKGADVLLAPTVCLHRSPLGGRNFESFSEDPLLTGELAAEYVMGLQSENVGATLKHFVANEQETRRFTVDETISDRALRELYLRPFETVVKRADPWAVMTSYNKVNGAYLDAQPDYLKDILREQWGFNGFVMSDWGSASEAVAEGIKCGMDLEMPGPPSRRSPTAVNAALDAGQLSVQDIDARLVTLMKLLRRAGKFTNNREPRLEQSIQDPAHARLIRKAGAEGTVLLKNSNHILPLRKDLLKKIAVLGPLAKNASAHGGGSASVNCHYKVNPYDALSERFAGTGVELVYSKGAHVYRSYPYMTENLTNRDGKPGFTAEYWREIDMTGEPFQVEDYANGFFLNSTNPLLRDARAVRITTSFAPEHSGRHCLSFAGFGPTRLLINGELVAEAGPATDCMALVIGGEPGVKIRQEFIAGQVYDIVLESISSPVPNADLILLRGIVAAYLGFVSAQEMDADLIGDAAALAAESDVAIVFVGNSPEWESEGLDMASMALPADGSQDRLVEAVAQANPNTIVVLTTGAAVELPWVEKTPAILQAFFGGQEVGNAIVDILLGEANPGGRLPFSWPRKYEHVGCFGHFGLDSLDSRKVEYVEGINVGYRYFDQFNGTNKEALFPFGHGLSYTTFDVASGGLSGSLGGPDDVDATVCVRVVVQNTGDRAGGQTIQVYLAPPKSSPHSRPPKTLVAFDKCILEPGERKELELHFQKDGAAYWNEEERAWAIEAGSHEVVVALSVGPKDVVATHELYIESGFTWPA